MVQRYNPDYAMHSARFEAFAREAEHGEYVRFDAHQQEVSALKAERDALAVENAEMRAAIDDIADTLETGTDGMLFTAVDNAVNLEVTQTDAALAAIQAQGVEKFADDLHKTAMAMCSVKPDNTTPGAYAGLARSFSKKLREAK